MSKDDVFRLFESAVDDEALNHRLDRAESPDKVAAIGSEMGFTFTTRELQEVLEEMHSTVATELGDDELDRVAGGVGLNMVQPSLNTAVKAQPAPVWTQGFFNDAILAERWLFIC